MNWFAELRRRLIALLGWFRRADQTVAPQRSLPPTPAAVPAAAPTPASAPAPAPVVVAALPSISPAVAVSAPAPLHRASPAPQAGEIVDPSPRPAVARVAAVPKAARVAQSTGPALDADLGQLKVRQFFARMIAATPAGLTIDFDDWRSASVERFFMAMTSPGLNRRREAPTSGIEQMSVTNAFQGFEWD